MSRIAINPDLCQGTGECAALAGSRITFDDAGVAHLADDQIQLPADLAHRLVATCPSMAISHADG